MKKIIYVDEENAGKELEFYLNDKNKLYLQCGEIYGEDSTYYSGWVCLSKEDVKAIIDDLQQLLSLM